MTLKRIKNNTGRFAKITFRGAPILVDDATEDGTTYRFLNFDDFIVPTKKDGTLDKRYKINHMMLKIAKG